MPRASANSVGLEVQPLYNRLLDFQCKVSNPMANAAPRRITAIKEFFLPIHSMCPRLLKNNTRATYRTGVNRTTCIVPQRCLGVAHTSFSKLANKKLLQPTLVSCSASNSQKALVSPTAEGAPPDTMDHSSRSISASSNHCPYGKALLEWLRANGAFIHPALVVVQSAPCGSRGVISTTPLPQGTVLFKVSVENSELQGPPCAQFASCVS